jgi:hypothetical protein
MGGIRISDFPVSESGLDVTILTTFHFANLEYRIYETGTRLTVSRHGGNLEPISLDGTKRAVEFL